jgi:hypothetical protein
MIAFLETPESAAAQLGSEGDAPPSWQYLFLP